MKNLLLLLLLLLVATASAAKAPPCKRRIFLYHVGEEDKPLNWVIFSNRTIYFEGSESMFKKIIVLDEADFSLVAAAVRAFKYTSRDTLVTGEYGTYTVKTDDRCQPQASRTYNPAATKRLFAYLLAKADKVSPEKRAGMRESLLTVVERL